MITRQIKDTVVAALRSGKYWQTAGTCKMGSQFCALGVAADTLGYDWADYDLGSAKNGSVYNYLEDLGFDADQITEIISLNDEGFYTLEEIADWIEEHIDVDDTDEIEQFVNSFQKVDAH